MRGAIRAWASVMARQSGCWGAGGSICGAALVAFTVLAILIHYRIAKRLFEGETQEKESAQ
jgi:hypothetical protein